MAVCCGFVRIVLALHKQIIVQAWGVASATTCTAPPKSWPQGTSKKCLTSVRPISELSSFWHCKPGLLWNLCRWCSISCRRPQMCCPSRHISPLPQIITNRTALPLRLEPKPPPGRSLLRCKSYDKSMKRGPLHIAHRPLSFKIAK